MTTTILRTPDSKFDWIDITNPTVEDFAELKIKYNLHEASIKDCIETGHLPKIEEFENYHFLIIRSIPKILADDSDSLIEVTERISIFYAEDFLITAHRHEIEFLKDLGNLK